MVIPISFIFKDFVKNGRKTSVLLLLGISILSGCVSSRSRMHDPEYYAKGDEILSTSDDSKNYPNWAFSEPRFVRDDVLFVSGSLDINGDQSPARGLDAAAMIARANLSSEIQQRLRLQMQYAAEGLQVEPQSLDQIINIESKTERLSGVYVAQRWYAKVKVPAEGQVLVRYRCFVLVGLALPLYRKQLLDSLDGGSRMQLSTEFKKNIRDSWDQFFGPKSGVIGELPKSDLDRMLPAEEKKARVPANLIDNAEVTENATSKTNPKIILKY